jgi:GT2 family glycosyltransferase
MKNDNQPAHPRRDSLREPGSQPEVFIIVLNWNGWRDTVECLESLQQLHYSSFRMVVVDNGSSDDSLRFIRSWASGEELVASRYVTYQKDNKPLSIALYSSFQAEAGGTRAGEETLSNSHPNRALALIRSDENRGFPGGCNIGIRYALECGAEYVWLLNNDTVVAAKALAEAVKLAQSDKQVGLIGSVLSYYHDPTSVQAYGGGVVNWWCGTNRLLTAPRVSGLDFLSGASLLIKRPVIESIGSLDESYFFYWDDVAYSQSALKAGWRIDVAEGSRILHKEGGTISGGERIKSLAADCFATRSMILFFSNHGGARWPLAVALRIAGILVNRVRRKQTNRVAALLKVAGATCCEVALRKVTGWLPTLWQESSKPSNKYDS